MEKQNIVEDLELEFKKFLADCKKKFGTTREGIEATLKILNDIKTNHPNNIENEIKNAIEIIMKPVAHASETKHYKLFGSMLSIIKKLVTYNLIKQNYTGNVINILKEILDYTSEEFIQIKVLETLLPMVNPQTINLTENIINNILIMCLKVFSLKNTNFKNPISALFKQLMISIYGFLDSFLRPVIEKKIFQKKLSMFHKQMLDKNIDLLKENLTNDNKENDEALDEKESPLHRNIDDFIEQARDEPYSDRKRRKSSIDNKPENLDLQPEVGVEEEENKSNNSSNKDKKNFENLNKENEPIAEEANEESINKENDIEADEETNNPYFNKSKRNSETNSPKQENIEEENQKHETNEYNDAEEDINTNIISKNSINNAKKNTISDLVSQQPQSAASPESELEKRYKSNPELMQKIDLIKIKPEDIDISEFTGFEIYQTSLAIFKSLIQISEGKKKDWIASSVYSKCLGLELIAGVICQSGFVIKFIPEFTSLIKTDLHKIKKKISSLQTITQLDSSFPA